MSEQYLYVAEFTVDGVFHTMSGYADNVTICEQAVQRILSYRRSQVPDEEVRLEKLHFKVSTEEKEKIVADSAAKNPDQTTTDPMLLHKSQAQVIDYAGQRGAKPTE